MSIGFEKYVWVVSVTWFWVCHRKLPFLIWIYGYTIFESGEIKSFKWYWKYQDGFQPEDSQ